MKRIIIAISLILLLALLTTHTPVSATSSNLLTTASYSFDSSANFGDGGSTRVVMIGGHPYSWLTVFFMVVFFCCIASSTFMCMFFTHRYFLQKYNRDFDIRPFLRITATHYGIFVVTLFLAFTIIFSLWIVVVVGLITQILGFLVYWFMNRYQGSPMDRSDILKAYGMSISSVSLILMLFL